MRTWGGRFTAETDESVADFTRSIEIDAALAADDIAGSIAHVRGLGRADLLAERFSVGGQFGGVEEHWPAPWECLFFAPKGRWVIAQGASPGWRRRKN